MARIASTGNRPIIQPASPATGSTVTINATGADTTLWLSPSGNLSSLTVTFPSDVNSFPCQIIRIGTTKAISTMTLNGASSILNPTTSMIANQVDSFQKVAPDTWAKI